MQSMPREQGAMQHEHREAQVWTCSMHHQIRLPEPGKCPICGMDLILAGSDDGADEGLSPSALQLSVAAMARAEIETAPVERRSVAHEVRLQGKIAMDETRLAYLTSWVAGRLDRLFVDYTGVSVRAGDHLAEIYSPTLFSAQQELLQSIRTRDKLQDSSLDIVRSTSDLTVISAREKLRLYGLSLEQIEAIIERGSPEEHITMRAPFGGVVVQKDVLEGMYVKEGTRIYTIADLSKLWVLLDAYESDLIWLRYGQVVSFQVEAYPGVDFVGRVAFIDPLLDNRTRTIKVRLNVDNTDRRLKPDMFVSARAQAVLTAHGKVVDADLADKWICPMHPEITAASEVPCPECGMSLVPAAELGFVAPIASQLALVIPSSAPLITGQRAVVYVRLPDRQQPTFEGREIVLGPRAGNWYVVHSGLQEGELVVVHGNFKLDSELQIRGRPSMMNPLSAQAESGSPEAASLAERARRSGQAKQQTPPTFSAQLGALLQVYLELQSSLARDEDSQELAQRIEQALGGLDAGLLSGPALEAWTLQASALEQSAKGLAAAWNLGRRRVQLSPFSEALVHALQSFAYDHPGKQLGVFSCPMAIDGTPASWIQDGATVNNPYMGASMLECGSLTETLEQGN